MRKWTVLGVLLVALCAAGLLLAALHGGVAAAQVEEQEQTGRLAEAVNWLVETHQNEDGGYTAFSSGAGAAPSDVGGTVDATLAIAAAGYNPAAQYPGREATPIGFLEDNPDALAAYAGQDGGAAGKLLLALTAAGRNPRTFAGHNFVISLTNHLSPTGQFGVSTPYNQALAILGLAAVREPVPDEAVQWLLEQQETEGETAGAWGDGFGTAGNADGTAMAIMALVAAGRPADDPALVAARDFLVATQQENGWEYAPGFGANANSTALVVQALSALGEDFWSVESVWAAAGQAPLAALLGWQSESGAFQSDLGAGLTDDFFTTVQAIPALAGKAYPWPGRYEAAQRAVSCLATLQEPATGGWPSFAGGEPDAGGTARAIEALVAAGADPESFAAGETTALEALAELAPTYLAAGRGGRPGILIQGVVAAGADPRNFAGYNLVISVTNALSPTGQLDDTSFGPYSHNQALLGLLAAGEPLPEEAVTWLLEVQTDGGWGDADGTGSSLQVLAALDMVPAGTFDVLRAMQLADGGWGFDASSPNSTAEVVQGLVAAGENPFSPAWSRVLSGTVLNAADAVLAQQGDDGCWPNLFGPGNDPFSTTDAILLLVAEPPFGEPAGAAEAAAQETPVAETAEPTAEATMTEEPEATLEPTGTPLPTDTPVPSAAPEATPEPAVAEEGSGEGESEAAAENDVGRTVSPTVAWTVLIVALAAVAGLYLWMRRYGG